MDYVNPNLMHTMNVNPMHVNKPMYQEPVYGYHHKTNVNIMHFEPEPAAAAPAIPYTSTAALLVLFILLVIILRSSLLL